MATTPVLNDDELDDTQDAAIPDDDETIGDAPKQDYGDFNEMLPEMYQTTLKDLASIVCDEFRYPRRLEVMKAWQARCFWREMQHLTWNWGEACWDVLGPAGYNAQGGGAGNAAVQNSAVLYSTNMYQGFGESFIAVITQAVPGVRFEPEDPTEAADIQAAKKADPARKFIQHENDPIKLMTKAAYYAWTDGRIHAWTRWEMDKRTKKPRVTQTIEGVMECKVPVIYGDQDDYNYVQFSEEHPISTVRAIVKGRSFPADYWKKIKGGSSGNGQDNYERTARISVKQGISMRSAGGDAYSNLCTVQRTWLRPSMFLDDKCPEEQVDFLTSLFPDGCYVEFSNGVYTGSKSKNMDDEWAIENIMEGDGANRNGKGTCLISVQERANDICNITQDVYEKTIPASHWDSKVFDIDAMAQQKSSPGERYEVNMSELPEGSSLESHVFYEPESTVSPDMLSYLKELMTDIPEFLTGISSILFGSGGDSSDMSGKALSIQQAAAVGRIGLPFRVIKRLYAKMTEQAVRCAGENSTDDMQMGIPNEAGQVETLTVEMGDLDGNIRCYPDSDENYPESWSAKRATYLSLMQMGDMDPTLHAILANPQNQNMAKKLIGLQELEIPDAVSWNKQLMEINLMLQSAPTPPQVQPPVTVKNPLTPDMETIQPPPIPPQSSIPIDPIYDNNAAEFLTVTLWINGEKGQEAKVKNPVGYENVRLHGIAHKQALLASMPPPPPAPAPGAQPPAPKGHVPAAKHAPAEVAPPMGGAPPPQM